MRVLLAEDDQRLGKLIVHMLQQKEISVDWVTSGDMAYEYAIYDKYDVIILDWMMPIESGISACLRLRKAKCQQAILMLTARDAVEDRVQGLDAGADDYLIKPFEFVELLARIRALSRRSSCKINEEVVKVGGLVLNRNNKTLVKDNCEIQLSQREFQIFDLLIQNNGVVVSRDVIFDRVWGLESDVSPNTIDSFIKILRKKLEVGNVATLIHTVRGIGYKVEI